MKKPGRNDICFCGSGKKFKNCCMAQEEAKASMSQSEARWIDQSIEAAINHHSQGRQEEARELYEAILQKKPDHAHALHFLGVIFYQQKSYAPAEQLMKKSIELNPSVAMYFCNLGMLLRDQKKYTEAVECHKKALALQPDYAEAHLNLGVALFHLDRLDEAAQSLRKTIQLQPGSVKAHDNLGTVLRSQYDYSGAIRCHERALEVDPGYVGALANLAATYIEVKNFSRASSYALKAIEQNAANADAYLYLGIACQEQGDLETAERFFLHASTLAPESRNTLWNLAITRLALGKLALGWPGYEYRWVRETGPVKQQNFSYPWWQGESMPDKTILVWGEQGVGDEIMFASMFAEVIARFKQCIIACNKKLIPLFKRTFPTAHIVDMSDKARLAEWDSVIDVQSAAGSLARWLRPTVASFPKKSSYLLPDAKRVTHWKQRLRDLGPGLKVGICWRSGNLAGNRLLYCTLLEQWKPILSAAGVCFINLQYDDCQTELDKASRLFGVKLHSFSEVDLFNDIDEAAALTKSLDLVISAPTSAAILAAALGVPVWMMVAGFEWQKLATPELCWYSSARVFPRRWDQKWEEVIVDIAGRLTELTAELKVESDAASHSTLSDRPSCKSAS